MLDVAAQYSVVYFMEKEPHVHKGNQKRRNFLSVLSEELCKLLRDRRFLAEQTKLPRHTVVCMGAFVSEQTAGLAQHQPQESAQRKP